MVGVASLGPSGVLQLREVFAATHNISLAGSVSLGWNSTRPGPVITALQGDNVNIQLTTVDTQHRFYVDVNKNAIPDCPPDKCSISYGTPTTFSFTVDFGPGTYTYYCSIHPSMTGTFNVPAPDFRIIPSPASIALAQGSSQTSTITVSSLNEFSGTVNLSLPNTPFGITAEFLTSPSLPVTSSSSGVSTLNITAGANAATGSYVVPVMGSNGTISHSASVSITVVVPDFAISFDSSSLSIVVGSSKSVTITLASQNGFAGNVNLTATVSPLGPTLSLNPVTVSLSSGGSGSSTLSIATTSGLYSSTPTGSYTVTVTAIGSPSLSHSKTLSAVVVSQSSPPATSNLPVSVLVLAGVAILATVLVVAYAVLRRKSGK